MQAKIIYSAFLLITTFLVIPQATKANHIPNNSQFLEVARNLRDRPDFFEEGRQQFEEEIKILEKERHRPVLTLEISEGLKWQNFILRDGVFTIWMPPGTMTEETKEIETTELN